MDTLNFGGFGEVQAVNNHSKRLPAWSINKVKFAGCKVDHIQGKKDPSITYDILKTRFEGEDGYYEESTFFPRPEDGKRPEYDVDANDPSKGKKVSPSNWERTQTFIAQLATVINEEGYKKFQAASTKFKSFDDVCKALIAITDPAKGKEVYLKLSGRMKDGVLEPVLPKFVALTKQGELFTSDNFVSADEKKLFFSEYEKKQIDKLNSAKPTAMPDAAPTESKPAAGQDDLDSLLGL